MKLLIATGVIVFSIGAVIFKRPADYPEARLTLSVVDESAEPVSGAKAGITFSYGVGSHTEFINREGFTDERGQFSATGRTDGYASYRVEKGSYYPSRARYRYTISPDGKKWLPDNLVGKVVLKDIKNPVPMYAKRVNLGMPAIGEPVGYDLEIGDWLPPHGKGQQADLVFTAKLDQRSSVDYDYELYVTFSKAGDGVIPVEGPLGETGSELRSPQEAPLDSYQPQWVQYRHRTAQKQGPNNYNPDRIYLLRLRTVLDEHGRILSANYAKIYGDFLDMTHYFNPQSNNRSLEFDRRKNLTKDRAGAEYINLP